MFSVQNTRTEFPENPANPAGLHFWGHFPVLRGPIILGLCCQSPTKYPTSQHKVPAVEEPRPTNDHHREKYQQSTKVSEYLQSLLNLHVN